MKVHIYVLAFLAVVCGQEFTPDQEWINLNPFDQPPGNTLHAVDFVYNLHGWAVGDWGIVIRTDDGGHTWKIQQNYTLKYDLLGVDFVDPVHGWAVGENGIILRTSDGGWTWTEQTSSTLSQLTDVFFLNSKVGYVVGWHGIILHTSDGGDHWTLQDAPIKDPGISGFQAVTFLDSLNGWTVGFPCLILRTFDGGKTWISQTNPDDCPCNTANSWTFNDVEFVDRQNGWIAGTNYTLRTTNWGLNWDVVGEGYRWSMAIAAQSSNEVWIVGDMGRMSYTNNGGTTWESQESHAQYALHDIALLGPHTLIAVGSIGTVTRTIDGGNTWNITRERQIDCNLSRGIFVTESKGWFTASFPGVVWHTQDGGLSWDLQLENPSGGMFAIEFIDSLTGWISGSSHGDFILRTVNGGKDWERNNTPSLLRLAFLDQSCGVAAGGGSLYWTEDGGRTWSPATVEFDHPVGVRDIFMYDSQIGYAGGGSYIFDVGNFLKTTDGGRTWSVLDYRLGVIPESIHFFTPTHGLIAGFGVFSGGAIMTTRDGGLNWDYQYLPSAWLHDMLFINDSTGWAVGEYGFIWFTSDSGNTWSRINTETRSHLGKICFVEDNKVGYILGEGNTLLKYDRRISGTQFTSHILPDHFALLQNFPNPFNPATTIRYELPHTSEITLSVYDLLGREVARLVDGYMEPGYHEVHWNGREFASGIYIARLVTPEYSKTIKMVLLK